MKESFKIGELRNGSVVLPKEERTTILLLSDDLRMSSGIAVMSKDFVFGLIHRYNFVQLSAAVKHPEAGKELDLNKDVQDRTGVPDAQLRLIPSSGYGTPDVLRQLLGRFNPDGIMIFTDPRYFRWIFDMEAEVREHVPIMFYTIWDDLPLPMYNKTYYASCDGLFCISKQTYGIVNNVLEQGFDGEFEIINNIK